MFIIFLTFFALAFADESEIKNLVEKSHTHDNTFCNLNGTRVEFQLRGLTKFTEPKEKSYGEFGFYRTGTEFRPLPLNLDNMNSYRFFYGKETLCSKSFGFKLSQDTTAVIFQKENKPYVGKLVILLYDHLKHIPKTFLEPEYATNEIIPFKDGFAFKVVPERDDLDMGAIKINGIDYTYQDRDFHIWMSYNLNGFKIQPKLTFEKFPWKNHFKDQNEFFKATGWNEKAQQFTHIYLYIAVNHQLKKNCLFISPTKVKITGSESWHCL